MYMWLFNFCWQYYQYVGKVWALNCHKTAKRNFDIVKSEGVIWRVCPPSCWRKRKQWAARLSLLPHSKRVTGLSPIRADGSFWVYMITLCSQGRHKMHFMYMSNIFGIISYLWCVCVSKEARAKNNNKYIIYNKLSFELCLRIPI